MTFYAHDAARGMIISSWDTAYGRCAADVVSVASASLVQGRQLALAFELLSAELWRDYVHPASEAPSTEVNTEGWRRERRREDFAGVVQAIRDPNLPYDDGMMIRTVSPLEEAHQLGRALRIPEGPDIERVVAEAQCELDAIEQAERGDFTERAVQALELSRTDVSPLQVARAHELLRENPLRRDLAVELDPTSAAVAVAEWLVGAAEMTSPTARVSPENVVSEADNIQVQDIEPPTEVISRLRDGDAAIDVVVEIVRHATTLAEGEASNIVAFTNDLDVLTHDAQAAAIHVREPVSARLALADPRRPAPSLLASLQAGIHACALLYDDASEMLDDEQSEKDAVLDSDSDDLEDLNGDREAVERRDRKFAADLREYMDQKS